jgi:hypothetical protein
MRLEILTTFITNAHEKRSSGTRIRHTHYKHLLAVNTNGWKYFLFISCRRTVTYVSLIVLFWQQQYQPKGPTLALLGCILYFLLL